MLKSYAGTPRSGTQTPVNANRDEHTSGVISEELYARLEALSAVENFKREAYTQSVEWLATDRGKASLEERENSLLFVLSILANKHEPLLIDSGLVGSVAKAVFGRSELESVVALQLLAVCVSELTEDHPHYDDCMEIASSTMPRILSRIQDPAVAATQRAQMATGYSVLQYILNSGGGGFNVEPLCDELFSIAESTTTKEAQLTAACIMGVGLIMTLARDADSIIEDLEPTLGPFFDINDPEVRASTAKLVGLFYEKYQLKDLDPTDVREVLLEAQTQSARQVGKKDQQKRRSLVRDVLSTIEQYQSGDKSSHTLTRFTLSKTRSISITSWKDLFVIQHLKWLYGPGLHSQLANNPWAGDLFKSEEGDSSILEDDQQEEYWEDKPQRAVNRRKERFEKMESRGLVGDQL